jgi:hypothetical protein
MPFQGSLERGCGARAMGVLGLPVVAELCHRLLLALRDEDRVEAETAGSPRLADDAAFEDARAAELGAGRRDGDQLTDVTRAPSLALDTLELTQQPRDVFSARESC